MPPGQYELHAQTYETRMDVDLKHDMSIPQVDTRSKGVRVLFK
jgi:hypothetical protein